MEKRLKEEAQRFEELEKKAAEKAKNSEHELRTLQQTLSTEKQLLEGELKRRAAEATELKAQIGMVQEANAQLLQQKKAQVYK